MNSAEIIEFLEENGLSEIKELNCTDEIMVYKLFYDFDKEEIEGAKAYANEESDVEEESNEWYKEWFCPYLLDIAKDNVLEIAEELKEEFEVELSLKDIEGEGNSYEYVKFLLAICRDDFNGDIEEVLNDYL